MTTEIGTGQSPIPRVNINAQSLYWDIDPLIWGDVLYTRMSLSQNKLRNLNLSQKMSTESTYFGVLVM